MADIVNIIQARQTLSQGQIEQNHYDGDGKLCSVHSVQF